jgi:hypothetical protein
MIDRLHNLAPLLAGPRSLPHLDHFSPGAPSSSDQQNGH